MSTNEILPETTETETSTSILEEQDQVDLKVKRVKALKTGLKGGLQSRISGTGRGLEEA